MKVLLLETVEGLGRPGDQVDVKSGFARNYLMPHGKAVRVSADSLRMLGRLHEKAEAEERAMVSSMEELASKVDGVAVEVQARATEEGHLFGSVTEKDVHAALAAAGWADVTQRMVRMAAHLKDAGEHEVELHLYGEIRAAVQVTVVPIDSDGQPIEILEEEAEEGEGEGSGDGEAAGDGDTPKAEGEGADAAPGDTTPATADA